MSWVRTLRPTFRAGPDYPSSNRGVATSRPRLSATLRPETQWSETRKTKPGKISANSSGISRDVEVGSKRFADFDLAGKVYIVTGGARGLGLAQAEALVEAGGKGES